MARICMVTVDHTPDDDRIFHKESKSLLKAGHEVIILCVADDKGQIWQMGKRELLNPGSALGFSLQGVWVKGVIGPKNKLETIQKKIFKGGFIKRFIKEGQNLKADVYHAHEPVSLYLAFQIAGQDADKVVFDSHESWIEGTPREQWVKQFYLPKLKHLITANAITRGHLLAKNPYMEAHEIYNYPEAEVFHYPFEENKFEQPIIAHDGLLPFNRGLRDMTEAIKQLKEKYPNIQLRIIGDVSGKEKVYLDQQIQEFDLSDNIKITGWVPYEEVPIYLKDCAIGLILKTNRPLNNLLGGPAIKFFNYLASGMAVIDAGLHESSRFLNQTKSGISLEERSPETLSNAISYLLENKDLLKTYCYRSWEASKEMKWEHEAQKLINIYNERILASGNRLRIR